MQHGRYNARGLVHGATALRFDGCIHQNLNEVPGDPTYSSDLCGKPLYLGGVHGWLCEDHFHMQTRRRSRVEDLDRATILFVLRQDERAIEQGTVTVNHGLLTLS